MSFVHIQIEGEGVRIMDWNKFWALFHHAWGQAKESPEYKKSVFSDMQGMLQNLQQECRDRENDDLERQHMRG